MTRCFANLARLDALIDGRRAGAVRHRGIPPRRDGRGASRSSWTAPPLRGQARADRPASFHGRPSPIMTGEQRSRPGGDGER